VIRILPQHFKNWEGIKLKIFFLIA
jgi:hypothetical protein